MTIDNNEKNKIINNSRKSSKLLFLNSKS